MAIVPVAAVAVYWHSQSGSSMAQFMGAVGWAAGAAVAPKGACCSPLLAEPLLPP